MTRLPPRLAPLWSTVKKVHLATARAMSYPVGVAGVRPARATQRSFETARREPSAVNYHHVHDAFEIVRSIPHGHPEGHRAWEVASRHVFPEAFVLEVERGRVVGQHGAVVTANRTLDLETSHYFGTDAWRENPVFISPFPTRLDAVAGEYALLASAGTGTNFYHFMMDALPRIGRFADVVGLGRLDGFIAHKNARFHAEAFAMLGIDPDRIIAPTKRRAIQPDRLWVASFENRGSPAPPETTAWLRANLRPNSSGPLPKRIYVTRGDVRGTRHLVQEAELLPKLRQHGFEVINPEALPLQDQINHFAQAEIVVAPHGAGLTNLNFAPEGVKVLELFAPSYVDLGPWAIASNVQDSTYRYLIGTGRTRYPAAWKYDPMADIDCAVSDVMDALADWV